MYRIVIGVPVRGLVPFDVAPLNSFRNASAERYFPDVEAILFDEAMVCLAEAGAAGGLGLTDAVAIFSGGALICSQPTIIVAHAAKIRADLNTSFPPMF